MPRKAARFCSTVKSSSARARAAAPSRWRCPGSRSSARHASASARGCAGHDEPGAADDLDDRADVGRDGGPRAEHRLDEAGREALDGAGEDDDRGGGVGVLQGGRLRAAELLEGDGVLADGVRPGGLVGEELRGEPLAVGEVRVGARVPHGDGDDPQPGVGLPGPDVGEGVQQGDEVLGGFGAADPDQGGGVAALLVLADPLEAVGRHAGVDGADAGPVGAALLLPAAGVGVAGVSRAACR